MLKKIMLKPIDTATNRHVRTSSKSPLKNHMKQLSQIIGDNFKPSLRMNQEPSSAIVDKFSIKLEETRANLPKKLKLGKNMSNGIEEAKEEYEIDEFFTPISKRSAVEIKNHKLSLSPIENDNGKILNQNKIDDINFISILMHVNGEDQGVNVANDKQFYEICNLMNEYYGINEGKILNKYEIWKKYIKNLKMQKNFEERSRDGELAFNIGSEKDQSKDEMVKRYSAFLSKKWFANADPFLKAKYKDFYKESEVKWGPNMIFKRLSKETEKLNKIKNLVEQRLNKEIIYVNNKRKEEKASLPKMNSTSSLKSDSDEDYDHFFNQKHYDTCQY